MRFSYHNVGGLSEAFSIKSKPAVEHSGGAFPMHPNDTGVFSNVSIPREFLHGHFIGTR